VRDDVKHIAQRVVDGGTALDLAAVRECSALTASEVENGTQTIRLGQEAYDGTAELATC
jgi:hypothetical protein